MNTYRFAFNYRPGTSESEQLAFQNFVSPFCERVYLLKGNVMELDYTTATVVVRMHDPSMMLDHADRLFIEHYIIEHPKHLDQQPAPQPAPQSIPSPPFSSFEVVDAIDRLTAEVRELHQSTVAAPVVPSIDELSTTPKVKGQPVASTPRLSIRSARYMRENSELDVVFSDFRGLKIPLRLFEQKAQVLIKNDKVSWGDDTHRTIVWTEAASGETYRVTVEEMLVPVVPSSSIGSWIS